MVLRRSGLIIASDTFEDPRLRQLRAPGNDAQELADVLSDPKIGDFEVRVSINQRHYEVRVALEDFFDDRRPDDVLLLHFSCHGIKDEAGRLFFAVADTQKHRLNATAIAADYVNDLLNRTRSRHVVLFLDCCFSGAFTRGMLARGDDSIDVQERFQGRGRAVLTATSALEYAWEGDALERLNSPSIFTSAVVRGLRSGEADRDNDQLISVDDLYDYVFEEVRRGTSNQTPSKWSNVEGMLIIARSARAVPPRIDPMQDAVAVPTAHQTRVVESSAFAPRTSAAWLPAFILAVGWIAAWLVGFALATSAPLTALIPSSVLPAVVWFIAAPATAVALRRAAPELSTQRLMILAVGWPVCLLVGLGVPLAARLGFEGATLLTLGVVAGGLLSAIALIPAVRPIPWSLVAVVVAGWSAGWLVSGATVWPETLGLNERGYYGTFPDMLNAASVTGLLAGAVLGAVVGCALAYLVLPRPANDARRTWRPRAAWAPALVVACGWSGAWLAALILARSSWIPDVTASVVLIMITWITAAPLTAAALGWVAPGPGDHRVKLIAFGWPFCTLVGLAVPLMLQMGSEGATILGIGIIAAGLLVALALSARPAVSPRALLVVAGWTAGWLVFESASERLGNANWVLVFGSIANGSTLGPALGDAALISLSVGAVLSAIVGCTLAYFLLLRPVPAD